MSINEQEYSEENDFEEFDSEFLSDNPIIKKARKFMS